MNKILESCPFEEPAEKYKIKQGKKGLNNEEWFCQLSTEEKAKFLFGIAYMCSYCGDEAHSTEEKIQKCHLGKCCCQRQDWEMWLKQPHKEKRK